MIDSKQPFPQNSPYMQTNSSSLQQQQRTEQSQKQRKEESNTEMLIARIQDLEQKLTEVTAVLAEDNKLQEAYAQLEQENEELGNHLAKMNQGKEEADATNQLLKENLFRLNEEMEGLYRQLQQTRNSQSRLQERGHSQLLESKVQQLNDEISNLLVKIQELVDENNAQQEALVQIEHLKNSLMLAENRSKEFQVENQILKEEIHDMEEQHIEEVAQLKREAEQLRNTQRAQPRPGQIRGNTERGEDKAQLQQEIYALRAELATRNEEQLEQRQMESQLRRKWEERLATSLAQACAFNQQVGKLKIRLRQQESKCSQYEFVLEQQQKDRERLAFYKSNYADSETLRSQIVRLEAEKEQFLLRNQRLKAEISQRKFEPPPIQVERNETFNFMHEQTVEQLQNCKRLNKQLKASIGKYQQDYKKMREEYEYLLQQKIEAQRIISANQLELQKHKVIYQQVVARCNATAADYKELEKKIKYFEGDRAVRPTTSLYDKENIQLIKLQNSTLRQEINALKDQLPSIQFQGGAQMKRRQRQLLQELQMYRQKYLKELERGKKDQQLQDYASDLEEKLARVNRHLNDKLKELEYYQSREKELLVEVDQAYTRSKMQLQAFGVRHHPEVKKLQAQLLAAQRQIMESELAFKTQISSSEDGLKACRLENQHHRAKIDQLLLEVNRQRNSMDYSKLARSLELAQLKQTQLQRQITHKDAQVNDLRVQLKQLSSRERSKADISLTQKAQSLQTEKENLQIRLHQQEASLQSLTQCLNAIEPATRTEEPLRRATNFISRLAVNSVRNNNDGRRRDSTSSKQSQNSRYEQLARKKSLISEQFKHSQQFLSDKWQEGGEKKTKKQEKGGILRHLQENWGS